MSHTSAVGQLWRRVSWFVRGEERSQQFRNCWNRTLFMCQFPCMGPACMIILLPAAISRELPGNPDSHHAHGYLRFVFRRVGRGAGSNFYPGVDRAPLTRVITCMHVGSCIAFHLRMINSHFGTERSNACVRLDDDRLDAPYTP